MIEEHEAKKAFRVHGRVQGVGFRWWAMDRARALGLNGTVRNCFDGTVEIEFAGSTSAVDEMCALLESGPRSARVERLEELEPPERSSEGFQIDH